MAIVRTPMVDDDGTGTTGTIINNQWKQELYGQVDAAISTFGIWLPADASGAGLGFVTAEGMYCRQGELIQLFGRVIYPGNTDARQAGIANLPFLNGNFFCGCYSTFGPSVIFFMPVNDARLNLYKPTGSPMTNAELSGAQLIFQGAYRPA